MHKTAEQRLAIHRRLAYRRLDIKVARAIGERNYTRLVKLKNATPANRWYRLTDLLTKKRQRDAFKRSLRNQVISWYREPLNKYASPLSRRQWDYL